MSRMCLCLKLLLGNNVILGSEHVELGVLEDLIGVLDLGLPLLDRLLDIHLLSKHLCLHVDLALELGWLRVEPIIEGHFLAHVAVLPHAEAKRTYHSGTLEHSNSFIQSCLLVHVCKGDLPELEADGNDK